MHLRNSKNSSLLVALTAALLLIGIATITAQELGQADGRINKNAHFGGDALYCTPADTLPSDEDSFRLLNSRGQVLWGVSASDVRSALDQVASGEPPVLIDDGNGSYGSVALYASLDAASRYFFLFTGYDEHGKANSLVFYNCTPLDTVGNTLDVPIRTLPSGVTSTPTTELATPTDAATATNTPAGPTATYTAPPCGESC